MSSHKDDPREKVSGTMETNDDSVRPKSDQKEETQTQTAASVTEDELQRWICDGGKTPQAA